MYVVNITLTRILMVRQKLIYIAHFQCNEYRRCRPNACSRWITLVYPEIYTSNQNPRPIQFKIQ